MFVTPSTAMLIYALVYVAGAVTLAVYLFEHCDL